MGIPVQIVFLGTAVAFAAVAAVHDLRDRRIPNWLTGSGIAAGLLLHLIAGGPAQAGWSLLAGLGAGAVFLIFYLAGGMGAGDVKLIAAVGCLVGVASIKDVLLATVFIGAIFAIGLAAYRGRLRETVRNVSALIGHHLENGLTAHPDLNVTSANTLRLAYALPIALGCFITFCLGSFGGGS